MEKNNPIFMDAHKNWNKKSGTKHLRLGLLMQIKKIFLQNITLCLSLIYIFSVV